MYRGINGTPPSRALSCPQPNPPQPPPASVSSSSFLFRAFSLALVFSFCSFLLVFRLSFSLTATTSNPLPSFQLHPSLSLYYMYARMYICTSFCLAPLVPPPSPAHPPARRLTTLTPLRPPSYSPAQHTSQIGSRATLYPVPVCTVAG